MTEIKTNDYSLYPSDYIVFVDRDANINFAAEMEKLHVKLSESVKRQKQALSMLESAMEEIGYGIK